MLNALLLSALLMLQSITVSMDHAPAGVVVPGAVASIRGQHWSNTAAIAYPEWPTLAGYSVTLGGAPCLLRFVNDSTITFVVPDDVPTGTHTVTVTGPAGGFSTNAEVVQYAPRLLEQGGYVIATSARTMFPVLYTDGAPIPVSPADYNLLSVKAVGIPTSTITNVRVILDGPEHYEIAGRSASFPGFAGVVNIIFFGPSCANGTYSIIVEVGGQVSAAGAIRFTAECVAIPERPERVVRVR